MRLHIMTDAQNSFVATHGTHFRARTPDCRTDTGQAAKAALHAWLCTCCAGDVAGCGRSAPDSLRHRPAVQCYRRNWLPARDPVAMLLQMPSLWATGGLGAVPLLQTVVMWVQSQSTLAAEQLMTQCK